MTPQGYILARNGLQSPSCGGTDRAVFFAFERTPLLNVVTVEPGLARVLIAVHLGRLPNRCSRRASPGTPLRVCGTTQTSCRWCGGWAERGCCGRKWRSPRCAWESASGCPSSGPAATCSPARRCWTTRSRSSSMRRSGTGPDWALVRPCAE